jgi:hypothetical protein
MNKNPILPKNFDNQSRVWIYQSDRAFSTTESAAIDNILQQFVSNWLSHGDKVLGFAQIYFDQFIVIAADETQAGVSGCSTDSSVKVIQQISAAYNLNLFNRQNLAFYIEEQLTLFHLNELYVAVEQGIVNENTLYFNNTVLTKEQFETNWLVPIKNSWLKNRLATK